MLAGTVIPILSGKIDGYELSLTLVEGTLLQPVRTTDKISIAVSFFIMVRTVRVRGQMCNNNSRCILVGRV